VALLQYIQHIKYEINIEKKTLSQKLITDLETIINQLLIFDKESLVALSSFKGIVVAVDVQNTSSIFYITITESGVSLTNEFELIPDIIVRGSSFELYEYLISINNSQEFQTGKLEVAGDISVAQKIQSIVKNLDIDWEDYISNWIGDSLTHKLGRAVKNSINLLHSANKNIKYNLSDYLRYETEYLIDRNEQDEFSQSVDVLRDDAERLKLRINRIVESIKIQ
jgi:ubiquinone biosynthesis protein UbiJ